MAYEFKTTVHLSTEDGDDSDLDVTVFYDVEKGFAPSYYEPGCSDTAFIQKVVETGTGIDVGPILTRLVSSQELERALIADWKAGQDGMAYDYRRSFREAAE